MNTLFERSIEVLELPKVTRTLSSFAESEAGKARCEALLPAQTLYESERLMRETEDAFYLVGLFGAPSFSGLRDMSGALSRADKGGVLSCGELLQTAQLLRCARSVREYVKEKKERETVLDGLFFSLRGDRQLEDAINAAIMSPEELFDTASHELYEIRKKIRLASGRVRDVLTKITSGSSKMLQDNIITQRNGRYVVPVKAEYKAAFGGLVHDVSASGATLFIEPSSVVELNNEIRVLTGKEKAEEERILTELSAQAADAAPALSRDFETLVYLDEIFAKAKFAYETGGMRPRLSDKGKTELIRARHPLLDRKNAVPIDFTIGGACDTVVITGPNTGGKTVSIKTLGLLTLMAQCGLYITASEESSVRVFENIYADVGDEQSIEQSLSTFSAHMTNIVGICDKADGGALVLLDELGAGTDPAEGAALAVSIIEELRKKGAFVAATTHYAELKAYALTTKGVENASCEFDVKTLKPTYRLIFGVPGKSNAFAIASRLGLSEHIIKDARERVDSDSRDLEKVIETLEEKRQSFEEKTEETRKKLARAEEMSKQAESTLSTVESERERLISDAKREAREILENARAAADMALTDARRAQHAAKRGADVNLAEARAALMGAISEAEEKARDARERRKPEPPPRKIVRGDEVEIVSSGTRATALSDEKDGSVLLQAGIMKITVAVCELRLCAQTPKKEEKPQIKVTAPRAEKTSLDVRGMTGDEAMLEVERYIDNARRLNLETVTVIHGKGTGALRARIQSELKRNPQVKSIRNGNYGEGEMGVTVVTLKK
ncbi:MAG: endonuclease MutS2 [Clostridia bacterium]|nr:endonuclease MutS2 [Clostridia bacterium]